MNKVILGILSVAVLALGAFGILKQSENKRLAGELREAQEAAAEETTVGKAAPREESGGEIERLVAQVKELEGKLAHASAGGAKGSEETGAAKSGPSMEDIGKAQQTMVKKMSDMMDDPSMRAMMKQQQGVMIDGMYGALFEELGLDEGQTDQFRELLLEKQMVAMEAGMKMMGSDVSKADRKDLEQVMKGENDRIDEEIKSLLGEEKFDNYELFNKSQPERQALSAYKESLKGRGLALTRNQEEQLMDAMYDERTNFTFSVRDFMDQSKMGAGTMEDFTKENLDTYLGDYRRLQAQIVERARPILDEAQLAEFEASQEGVLKMQEMGMRMGLSMMEGGKDGE